MVKNSLRERFPQSLTLNVNFDFDKGAGRGLILKYVKLQGDYKLDLGYSGSRRFEDEEEFNLVRSSNSDDFRIEKKYSDISEDYDEESEWSHLFTLRADKYGNYWRRTKFKGKLTHRIKNGRRGGGTEHRTNVAGEANHKRIIRIRKLMRGRLSGQLMLSARLNFRKTDSDYQDTENTRVRYNAQYKFSPFRNTRMTLAFERREIRILNSRITMNLLILTRL